MIGYICFLKIWARYTYTCEASTNIKTNQFFRRCFLLQMQFNCIFRHLFPTHIFNYNQVYKAYQLILSVLFHVTSIIFQFSYFKHFQNIQDQSQQLINKTYMGCGESSVKQNIIIEVAYCGSCGWSMTGKKVADAIKKKLPSAVIDCRPQNEFTGLVKATLIINKSQRKQVYRGDKDKTNSSIQKIATDVAQAYRTA